VGVMDREVGVGVAGGNEWLAVGIGAGVDAAGSTGVHAVSRMAARISAGKGGRFISFPPCPR
ncbi:MAG TPA: hypothetical protein PLS77_11980, partial [Anaerolineaceae bacterium]|nr:hypothetical protein [Anaerolineaceae bacterium]